MDLSSLAVIQDLCKQYGIIPRRDRGQNFLVDEQALHDIVAAAQLMKDDTVLEIGPGFGVLTAELATAAKEVIAVELDRKLVSALQEKFAGQKNITIIQEDILQWWKDSFSISQFLNFKIVANLPYQITSHILRIILESESKPELIVVMVQKEVAERIVAKAGEMSILSVMVQYYATAEIVRVVPRSSFWPAPEVDSAILRIRPNLIVADEDFFRIVKMGFASRRKQLQNNLAAGLHVSKEKIVEVLVHAGFLPTVRAQELSIDDWKRLASRLS